MEHALLVHQGVTLTAEPKFKFLGVIVDKDLNWSEQVTSIRRKCLASLAQLRRIFPAVPGIIVQYAGPSPLGLLQLCLGYMWSELANETREIHNYAMRLITSAKPRTPSAQLRSELSWMSLQDRREICKFYRKSIY